MKRILNIYPSYSKPLDGYNIAKDIGLYKIWQECKHFNEWVEKLMQKFQLSLEAAEDALAKY